MNIASTALLAYMIFDFMQPMSPAVPPDTGSTVHAAGGVGTLTVSIDDGQTVGSVARGASRVPFLSMNLSASCEAPIKVTTVAVQHIGLGLAQDISGVYALDGYTRVTRAARFDAKSQTAVLRFRPLQIPKCGAVSLQIVGDIDPDATSAAEHGMTVTNAASIISTARQTDFLKADLTKRVVQSPIDAGGITVRFLPVSGLLEYGRIETVARIQITADRTNAHLLQKITLTNKENARDMDLQWLQLETLSGKPVTPFATRMHNYTVVLNFDPTYVIHAGDTLVFNLKADVRKSITKKVDFRLEERSDLVTLPYRDR